MARFLQMQSSGTLVHTPENSDATPSLRKQKVDKASLLLSPLFLLQRLTGSLDIQRRQSARPLTKCHGVLCMRGPSCSIPLGQEPGGSQAVVRQRCLEDREGMSIRKQGEYQGHDPSQKRTGYGQRQKEIPHDQDEKMEGQWR